MVAFHRHALLPLDDRLYALQPSLPHLTRSSLQWLPARCRRVGNMAPAGRQDAGKGPTQIWDWDCPASVDGLRLRFCRRSLHIGFVSHGRAVAQSGMQPHRVVSAFNVAEAGHASLGLRRESATAEQLGFQGREEAFGHGVVVGVAD